MVEIQEFEVSWTPKKPKSVDVYLIGEKLVLLKPGGPEVSSMFYPMFNKQDQIVGTQFLPIEQGQDGLDSSEKRDFAFIQIRNMADKDY